MEKRLAEFHGYRTTKSWDAAVQHCSDLDMALAFPRTTEDLTAMKEEFTKSISSSSNYLYLWIGLNDKDEHEVWRDLNGIVQSKEGMEMSLWGSGFGSKLTHLIDWKDKLQIKILVRYLRFQQPYNSPRQIILKNQLKRLEVQYWTFSLKS